MRTYVTIFDSNYMAKGVAMIHSLLRHSSEKLEIHVLAMDENCQRVLCDLPLPVSVRVWPMDVFAGMYGMEEIRLRRTHREFCWTCGALFTHMVANHEVKPVTYVDADCFFYSDPKVIHDESSGYSLAVTPHRFAKKD